MKRIVLNIVLIVFVLLIASNVSAQTKLTSEAALAFLDFYFKGQGQGVVIADMKVCTQIEENECAEAAPVTALKKGEKYLVWMMFVVPRGDKVDNILLQYNQNGITRSTKEVSVEGSIRYRTWKTFIPNKTGEWELKVLLDKDDGVLTLKTLTVTVVE